MYPVEVIRVLKEALRSIYWYKDDLRLFLLALDLPGDLVIKQGWHDEKEYKVRIVSKILDELIAKGDDGLGPMRRIIQAVLDVPSFDHLSHLEDGAAKVQTARRSVEALRTVVLKHDKSFERHSADQKSAAIKIKNATRRKNDEIERLQSSFNQLAAVDDAQKRGFLFEGFLRELFTAFDLNPRGSFKIVGEQIDGAFEFQNTQFLLEARWQKDRQSAGSLDAFSKKVERKLDNTLGLFISLNGFTEDGLEAFRKGRPSIVLMDGEDLALALQGLIDFRELLKRKVRHASHTGDPYLKARDAFG
jgi:hypothetical protein